GGGDDERAARGGLAEDRWLRSGARTRAAEAEIDGLRRVGVVGHAGYGESRSPTHRRDDVGVASAAFAHDANGQYPSVPRSAGHTDAIVRLRRDDSRHACTVPGAIRDLAGLEADLGDVCVIDPVAWIGRVGIASVSIVCANEARAGLGRNEVISGDQTSAFARRA